jgi:hypothetical protein
MRRLLLGLMLGCVAVGSVGCTTCCTPYDHCGPTYTGAPGETCCASRQGSVLDYGSFAGEYDIEYGPSEVIPETTMPSASSDILHETNARRTKLRPIPDRTTSRLPAGTIRR